MTTGILLTNTGTPDAPTPRAVRRYLAQFLGDRRIIELPRWMWLPVLHGIILNTRPRRSAHAYQSIWTGEGSPLLTISQQQAAAITEAITPHFEGPLRVVLGMAYGNPSIEAALDDLRRADVRRLLVLPLYPQYSATTTAATFDAVGQTLTRWRWIPELRMVSHYYQHPAYIAALAGRVRAHWDAHGRADRLLLSFHGIPKSYFLNGDPYYCQCQNTARLLADVLGLQIDEFLVTFQSRFGPIEWTTPYLDKTLAALPGAGVKSVQVFAPSFSADCLETLEEIAIAGRETFVEAGGERFEYIPALNADPAHITALVEVALAHTQGWHTVQNDQTYCWQVGVDCEACGPKTRLPVR